jgi:rod shape-determining protein MreD
MKDIFKGLLVIVALLIQLTILNLFTLQGIKPDLILVVIIVFSLLKGEVEGSIIGFFSGLLQDIFSVGLLGVNAFIKTSVGFFCGLLKERMFAEHILFIIPLLTLFITVFKSMVLYLVLHAFGMETNTLFWNLKQIVIPEALYNGLLSPFIYLGIKKYLQIIEDRF